MPADAPIVLLVDDQRIFGKTIGRMLDREGDIEFHFCSKGAEAIATAVRVRPSVILQDLSMPDADGLDLILAYRAQEATRLTPLIVLSAEEEAITKAEAFRRGANDYLVKVPERVELIARVRYHSRAYRLMLQAEALHEAEKRRLIQLRQEEMLRARDTLIFALAKLAESRDTDTGEHLERIAAYCGVLAEQLRSSHPELDAAWIRRLQLASSLHDIGKVGIPDSVLLKPGPLTPEERRVIERHTAIGAAALDAIIGRDQGDELLTLARNIAASHHERWDGAGYPSGLRGGAIPLEARIVSVADVYDALTSQRVYKPAMPHDEAMEHIITASGTQFDPEIVEALRACESAFQRRAASLVEKNEHGRGESAHGEAGTA